jgi:hypothetical protein
MILQILQYVACVFTALIGVMALVAPKKIEGFTGLTAPGGRGITEFRAIFGAFFISLGVYPLISSNPVTYHMLGCAYLGVGVVRLVSIFLDKSSEQSNWISVISEFILGAILLF